MLLLFKNLICYYTIKKEKENNDSKRSVTRRLCHLKPLL